MKSLTSIIAVAAGALVLIPIAGMAGCSSPYRGAVYTRYSHVGLRIKSDPKTAIPVQIDIGHDHASGAYIPKSIIGQDDDGTIHAQGEVGSIISRFEVEANVPSPKKYAIDASEILMTRPGKGEQVRQVLAKLPDAVLSDEQRAIRDLLKEEESESDVRPTHVYRLDYENGSTVAKARSYFIAGTAAVVASLPDGKSVTFVDENGTSYTIEAKEPAGERLASALSEGPTVTYTVSDSDIAKRLRAWVRHGTGSCSELTRPQRDTLINDTVRRLFGANKVDEDGNGFFTAARMAADEAAAVWTALVSANTICP